MSMKNDSVSALKCICPPHSSQPTQEGCGPNPGCPVHGARVWEFDRYTNGRLKAEGIRITRAESEEQARLKAVRMTLPGDVLVMRVPEIVPAPLPSNEKTLRAALERIAKWFGEFPDTGRTWDDGSPMSYAACFGSNGERDFMRQVARVALEQTQFPAETGGEHHGLDNARQVFFYEQDFYVLSNFSSFRVRLLVDDGFGGEIHCTFDTSEAAYHWFKFPHVPELQARIRAAQSAHDAFKLAERYRDQRRPDWDAVKVDIMREILRAKAQQHEYVRRKLLATGDRELIENSWRDDFWGWGLNRDGRNQLGRLWMEIRAELRSPKKSGGT